MPIYEYECTKCGHRFEIRHTIGNGDSKVKCPKCQEGAPRRVFSTFVTGSSSSSCARSTSSRYT